ncbi:MAG: DUF3800 domain-containing protein [Rhabdochlamydiaceae bacterium]|jgi:hypothetical protein
MDFDVFCDESHPDLLASTNSAANFLLIGSLWMLKTDREIFKQNIHELREKHKIGPEFKWGKVSYSKLTFYKDLISWFWNQKDRLRFRCIVVDKNKVDLLYYHQNDQELGFYKFYYQLLHHWIADFNNYYIFCDFKTNFRRDRLHVLKGCLDRVNLSARVTNVQSTRSDESVLIQLVDVLTGLVSSSFNRSHSNESAKEELISFFEQLLKHPICPTSNAEKKCNIFKIDFVGGWE